MKNKTTVFAIGRWMPIHIGHKSFLLKLAQSFDQLVIGIGSCYENGTPRNCIPAIEREKLLRKIFKAEGIDNIIIIPIQDRPTFEEWIEDVCAVCKKYDVTHFCTGNKEDILDVMVQKGIKLDVEMINPEDTSDFPYHATDIRNAILRGETGKLDFMIPKEIKPMVLDQISREIYMASIGEGQEFIPGRQTVDIVFTLKNTEDHESYVLIGKRNSNKLDFPDTLAIPGGGIEEFESPTDAAARCFLAETGLRIKVTDNSEEPAEIIIENLGNMKAQMHFTGIYASHDERINGTRGGGSQCFAIQIETNKNEVEKVLYSTHDLENLNFINVDRIHEFTFAFDQKRMIFDSLVKLGIAHDKGELLQIFDEYGNPTGKGVSRANAHSEGILHGASHVYICKWENGKLFILLQRRSICKDSFPGCLDISSAGHIEQGSNFLETAKKEIFEELGLKVKDEELTELFNQRICEVSEFRGKRFTDNEVNKIYMLKKDVDVKSLKFQASEVSGAVWKNADEIIAKLEANDPEYCMNSEEFKKAIEFIKQNHPL